MITLGSQATGVSSEELHFLRFQCAVKKQGKIIMYTIFNWSYLGGSLTVHEYLFQNTQFTNTQFKKIFNATQRATLTSSDPVSSYDITLLYLLLHHVCDLNRNNNDWIPSDHSNLTLENMLYLLKQHRNDLAHGDLSISEQEVSNKLVELQKLFHDILVLAGARFSVPNNEIEEIVKGTEEYIGSLRRKIREPLEQTDVAELQQEFQEIQKEVKDKIQEMSKVELKSVYSHLCIFDPAPWLLMNLKVQLSKIYIDFNLKREEMTIQSEERDSHVQVHCDDVLDVRTQDGKLPEVIIIAGEGGMGKSTYLRYLIEMWMKGSNIIGLNDVELLLYAECRHPSIRNLDDLLKQLLQETSQKINVDFRHLRESVLHMQLLFLIDGYDEINLASEKLIYEILNLPGENNRVIITTRPGNRNQLLKLVPSSKEKIVLTTEGIAVDRHLDVVEKLCKNLVTEDIYLSLNKLLKKQMWFMQEQLGAHMNNPLTLTLLALLFLQDPKRTDALSTATQLYGEFRKLLTEKLTERLISNKHIPDLEYKCHQFLKYSDKMSFKALQRKEYELREDTIVNLKSKCIELDLPSDEVLSAYFTVRHSRNGLLNVVNYNYHHLRLQEYSAASYILDQLSSSNWEANIQEFLSEAIHWKSEKRFQSVLVHLSGLLAQGYDHILSNYADSLINLAKLDTTNVDFLLAQVGESKCNYYIASAAARKLDSHASEKGGWIDIKGKNNFGSIPPLLKRCSFSLERITLTITSQSNLRSHSEEVINTLRQCSSELVLDMHDHYKGSSESFTMNFFENLISPGALFKLCAYRGALNPKGILLLPSCITELRLRVDLDELNALNIHLSRLHHLAILGLRYQSSNRVCSEKFPALSYQGKTLCLCFELLVTDEEEDIEWSCSVIGRLCSSRAKGSCTSIVFPNTQLTFAGRGHLLHLLHQKGVNIERRIDFFSCHGITREEVKVLEDLCQSLYPGILIKNVKY